jgi:hypothetical protein
MAKNSGNKWGIEMVTQDTMKTLSAQPVLQHTIRIAAPQSAPVAKPVLLRQVLGEELRNIRTMQARTLREVSRAAQVSLGYLSEVERGQKEASSELLGSICVALGTPMSVVISRVGFEILQREQLQNSATIS